MRNLNKISIPIQTIEENVFNDNFKKSIPQASFGNIRVE